MRHLPAHIRKRALAVVALIATMFALVVATGSPVAAGTYWNSSACTHGSLARFVCFDASAGTVVVQTAPGAQTAYPAGAAFTPRKGFIAYDLYECNAAAPGYDTSFPTPGLYGIPSTVTYVVDGAGPPAPGNIYVSQSTHDLVAWLANSQTGYACLVVP